MPGESWSDPMVIGPVAAAFGAGASAIATFFLGKRRLSVESKSSLSKSEHEFRVDILARLDKAERLADACREERQACAEREIKYLASIEELKDALRDMRARIDDHGAAP